MTSKKSKAKNRQKYFNARAKYYGVEETKKYFDNGGTKHVSKDDQK